MQYKSVQGANVPEIGLGTYKLYGKECKRVVSEAIGLGYRHIDTAQMYKNEQEVGDAVYASGVDREEFFISTKLWHTNLDHDDVLQTAEDSLKALRTPYVDLLLIHWPNEQHPLEQTLEAMMTLKDQGKALAIGVSNFPLGLMQNVVEDLRIPVITNQVEFHPFLTQLDLLDYSYDNDFVITAYSPLAQGKVLNNDLLNNIGKEYGKSAAQVSLRWLIEQENVVAIPKASTKEHLQENIDVFDFVLSDEHFEAIDGLHSNLRLVSPTFAPDWDS
jgi:2,5-diketo-D-gluconate reductase B